MSSPALRRMQYYEGLALVPELVFASRRNARRNLREIAKIQEKKLKLVLQHAYDYNPYYHRFYKERGINPRDISSLKDFKKIPIIDRKIIQQNQPQMISVTATPENCHVKITSGSSGIPLKVLFDDDAALSRMVLSLRQFFESGGKWRDRHLEFRNIDDIHRSRRKVLSTFSFPRRIQVPINNLSMKSAISILSKQKPEVVFGYPSFLQILSEVTDKNFNSRLVFVTGEVLTSNCRRIVKSKFCGKLLDTYGCSEVGDIAWECPTQHSGYHTNADAVIIEFLKDGERVYDKEQGEIVLTDLTNTAMPFIRYRIGDMGIPTEELCSCGITLPLMRSLKGRSDDFVTLPSGKKISPLALLDLNVMNGILDFTVIQKTHKLIELLIKVKANANDREIRELISSMKDVVGEEVEIRACIVNEIPRVKSGKMRRIISQAS